MNRTLLVVLLALAALIAGPWCGARQSVQTMERGQEPGGLALNLAYWAMVVPGMSALVDSPRTALAVAYHQHRDGAELDRYLEQAGVVFVPAEAQERLRVVA